MKSSCLSLLLSVLIVSVAYNTYTSEVYNALQEQDAPRAIKELQNIKKREEQGFLRPMLLEAYRRGALQIMLQGLGLAGIGVGAGHVFNRAQPISQPLPPQLQSPQLLSPPQPIVANTVTNHAISVTAGGVGAAASYGIAGAAVSSGIGTTVSSWIATEVVGSAVGAPGVATAVTAISAVVGGIGGCTAAHAVQNTNAAAQNTRAIEQVMAHNARATEQAMAHNTSTRAAHDHQVAQTQSHTYARLSSGALIGIAGATVTLGPSLYHTVCNLPSVSSIHKCCQYKHADDGHNLWSIAFEMNNTDLITFSTEFLKYNPARDLMNTPMKNGMYPIHAAVRRGNHDLVELLIRNNVKVVKIPSDDKSNSSQVVLQDEAQSKDVSIPCFFIDEKDVEGNTALIYAVKEGNREIATTLLTPHEKTSHCAKITAPSEAGLTPLHIAAQRGYADCAEYLLRLDESDIDADHKNEHDSSLVNMQDRKGNTPLLHAAQHGHYSVVETLLDRPNKTGAADPFLANKEGLTPLMAACRIGHEYIASYLVQVVPSNKHKQFINQQDIQNRNALHHLLEGGSSKMYQIGCLLYNVGVDIDDITVTLVEDLGSDREDMQEALHITELHSRDQ